MEDLYRHRCSLTPLFPLCNAREESIEHLLLLCQWVATIWFGGSLNYKMDRVGISTLTNWLSFLISFNIGSKEKANWLLSYAAFTCWHRWKTTSITRRLSQHNKSFCLSLPWLELFWRLPVHQRRTLFLCRLPLRA